MGGVLALGRLKARVIEAEQIFRRGSPSSTVTLLHILSVNRLQSSTTWRMAGVVAVGVSPPDVAFKSNTKPSTKQASLAAPSVRLLTHTSPSYEQVVLGRQSLLTPAVEEFRGIPYGDVPARWEHSLLRRSLPQDVYDASRHGYVIKSPQNSFK